MSYFFKIRRVQLAILIVILSISFAAFGILIEDHSFKETSYLRSQNSSSLGQVESLKLTVLCDNYPNGDLTAEWGVSFLLETSNATLLFDTGQSYTGLRDNSIALNKDLSKVDFVVISHEHWDHIGGLSYIEEINPGVTVYVPEHMDSQTFNTINQSNLNAVKIGETTIIQSGIAIIGELNGPPYEQGLIVNVKDVGLIGIMGCSHPGVNYLMEKGVDDLGGHPYMVIGGFHMGGASEELIQDTIESLLELGIEKIYPIHCTGDLFREYMVDHYILNYGRGYVGFTMIINSFTIYSVYYTLIPVFTIPFLIIAGWFLRKRLKRS